MGIEMKEKYTTTVEEFSRILNLKIVNSGLGEMTFDTVNVNRPGLQLAGFFDYFGENRVQVMGSAEMTYFNAKPDEDKVMIMDMIMQHKLPCFIVTRNIKISPLFIEIFEKHKIPLFVSEMETSQFINNLIMYLNDVLAPTMTTHGVLVDVSGVGVLLSGKSGIGKSETALELVKRGHRLVADDAVVMKRINNKIYGSSPKIIRHFMEIRGIGILNVKSIFGVGAIVDEKRIDLVVEMENWNSETNYDRLTGNTLHEELLEIEVPKVRIPITAGRNLPIVIEAAATNFSLQQGGYDAASVLIEKCMNKK